MAEPTPRRVSRRAFVRLSLTLSGGALLAACAPQAGVPTTAPAKQAPPAATAAPAPRPVPSTGSGQALSKAEGPAEKAAAKGFVPDRTLKVGIAVP